MKDDVLLRKYKTLIFLSLEAQESNDVEQEERAIDALDVVWANMSNEERRLANNVNRDAIAWFNAKMNISVKLNPSCNIQSIGSLSQTSNVRAHPIDVFGIPGARFGEMVVHWEDSSFGPWTSSKSGSFPSTAATA